MFLPIRPIRPPLLPPPLPLFITFTRSYSITMYVTARAPCAHSRRPARTHPRVSPCPSALFLGEVAGTTNVRQKGARDADAQGRQYGDADGCNPSGVPMGCLPDLHQLGPVSGSLWNPEP